MIRDSYFLAVWKLAAWNPRFISIQRAAEYACFQDSRSFVCILITLLLQILSVSILSIYPLSFRIAIAFANLFVTSFVQSRSCVIHNAPQVCKVFHVFLLVSLCYNVHFNIFISKHHCLCLIEVHGKVNPYFNASLLIMFTDRLSHGRSSSTKSIYQRSISYLSIFL